MKRLLLATIAVLGLNVAPAMAEETKRVTIDSRYAGAMCRHLDEGGTLEAWDNLTYIVAASSPASEKEVLEDLQIFTDSQDYATQWLCPKYRQVFLDSLDKNSGNIPSSSSI